MTAPVGYPKPSRDDGTPLLGEWLESFLAPQVEQNRWLVDGMILDQSITAFVGQPASFKSMAAVQLGLSCAAGRPWLGFGTSGPRPFVYVSNEKTRVSVHERLERMTQRIQPIERVLVVHRRDVRFTSTWDTLVGQVRVLGTGTLTVLDTLASLADPGFDENSGRDMGRVLAALGELVEVGATVVVVHHPSKSGSGSIGNRMRGHSSLWGQADGFVEFKRDKPTSPRTVMVASPKDGDPVSRAVQWDRDTFLLSPLPGPMSPGQVANAVAELGPNGEEIAAQEILKAFPGLGRTSLLAALAEAVKQDLVERTGAGPATRYRIKPEVPDPFDPWLHDPFELED